MFAWREIEILAGQLLRYVDVLARRYGWSEQEILALSPAQRRSLPGARVLRPGYPADLAARTLGVAPVLRPATPSRYEPQGPQAELREITQVWEAEPPPQRARETAASAFLLAQVAEDGWTSGVSEPASERPDLPNVLTAPPRLRREPAPKHSRRGTARCAASSRLISPGSVIRCSLTQDGWAAPDLSEPASEPAATGVQVPADAAVPTPDATGPWSTAEAGPPRDRRAEAGAPDQAGRSVSRLSRPDRPSRPTRPAAPAGDRGADRARGRACRAGRATARADSPPAARGRTVLG